MRLDKAKKQNKKYLPPATLCVCPVKKTQGHPLEYARKSFFLLTMAKKEFYAQTNSPPVLHRRWRRNWGGWGGRGCQEVRRSEGNCARLSTLSTYPTNRSIVWSTNQANDPSTNPSTNQSISEKTKKKYPSINPAINRSINQSFNQSSINQSKVCIKQLTKQPTNQPISQSNNQSVNQPISVHQPSKQPITTAHQPSDQSTDQISHSNAHR